MEKDKFPIDKEELKNETKDTVDQIKDTIKNTDFKKDALETQGFVKEMVSNPIEAVKRAASGENILSKAIILIVLWIALNVLGSLTGFLPVKFEDKILHIIKVTIDPIVRVLAPALVILILNKNNKKSLITNICTMSVASIPMIAYSALRIVGNLVSGIYVIITPLHTALNAITLILIYFGVKELCEEEEDKNVIIKFAIVEIIAELTLIIVSKIL